MYVRPTERPAPTSDPKEASKRLQKGGETSFKEVLETAQAVDWVELSKEKKEKKKKKQSQAKRLSVQKAQQTTQQGPASQTKESNVDIKA